MIDPQIFISYLGQFSYLGIFVVMMFAGYGIPVPEEILLLLVGYLAGTEVNNVYLAIAVSVVGLLVGDIILYSLSRTGSAYINRLQGKFRPEKLARYEAMMRQHLKPAIFGFRFIPGLRFLGPFLAGSTQTSLTTFLIYDILALAMYTPLIILIGWHWHTSITRLITQFDALRHFITIAAVAIIGLILTYLVRKIYFIKPDKPAT